MKPAPFIALSALLVIAACSKTPEPVPPPSSAAQSSPETALANASAASSLPASPPPSTVASAAPSASASSAAAASPPAASLSVAEAKPAAPAPIECKTDDDCWMDDAHKPTARPKNLRGKKLRPCKDSEHIPVCRGGACLVNALKC